MYFVTQSPGDLPDDVLAQLGLRIQHGLRAFTAKEQKALRAVADGFRPNPAFNTLSVLTELGIGEALVGTLEEKGTPAMVQRVAIAPPQSRIGPLSDAERAALVRQSSLAGRYDKPVDRESAYELLNARAEQARDAAPAKAAGKQQVEPGLGDMASDLLGSAMKSALRQAANQLGRQLVRGLMGSLMGARSARNGRHPAKASIQCCAVRFAGVMLNVVISASTVAGQMNPARQAVTGRQLRQRLPACLAFFLDLLDFLLEGLIKQAGFLAPGFAVRSG